MSPARQAPSLCPVCSGTLTLTRVSCHACGSDILGEFDRCEVCALTYQEREILRVFLQSRGNLREVERHLSVSYPTARARFDLLLTRLGLRPDPMPSTARLAILERLERGEIDVDQAERLLFS